MIEVSEEEIEEAKRNTHKLNKVERTVMTDDCILMVALILRIERAEARIKELEESQADYGSDEWRAAKIAEHQSRDIQRNEDWNRGYDHASDVLFRIVTASLEGRPAIAPPPWDSLIEQMKKLNERLRDALDHIAKIAGMARTETKRLNWIAARAKTALAGDDWDNSYAPMPNETEFKKRHQWKQEIESLREQLRTARAALRPFADVGAWLFARKQVPDETPMVDLHGLNGQRGALTRGHFKLATMAIRALGDAEPQKGTEDE